MNILLIDDSRFTRQLIKKTLGDSFEIMEAESGEEARAILESRRPNAVLLANTLSSEDCHKICVTLRGIPGTGDLPIILLGTSPDKVHYEAGFKAGASAFLVKPFARDDLLRIIMDLSTKTTFERRQTVLIVEDSPSVRLILRKALENAGFDVAEAEDGRKGLDALTSLRVDFVSTDCEMPVMNGFEFVAAMKESGKFEGLPILMLTSLSDPATAARARELGIDAFLNKPFQPDVYVKKIVELLSAKENLSRYTIWAADDNLVERKHLENLLVKWEFGRRMFSSGTEIMAALESALSAGSNAPDLVLLDLFMPDLDGIDVLKRLREAPSTRSLPVIMISAFGNFDRIAECLEAGVNDFVVKPYVEAEILARIRIHLKPR